MATCSAGTATTITNVMNGTAALGAHVALTNVVATSPKFLLSTGATGACQWAIFLSERVAQAAPYSGAIVVTDGAPAPAAGPGGFGACPPGTDAIPTDAAPGDAFDVTADVIKYARADCATTRTPPFPAPEVRLANACGFKRAARGQQLPAPAAVPDVTELTNAATEAAHRKWTGVLVKLANVMSQRMVTATGSIQLTDGVRLRDRIYQPKTATFPAGTTFTSVVGLGHLDVCTWSIEPRDPCTDFAPKSPNCP
jgi:hypothetical protein